MAEHTVQIRYHATTNDIMTARLYAIDGTPHITDNGDGTYDLWSDDPCTFLGVGYDAGASASAYDNSNFDVTKIEVLSGHTLKQAFVRDFFSGDTYSTFAYFTGVTDIVWHGLNTMNILFNMFTGCENLTTLMPDNFFDGLKPIEVSGMFEGCLSLGHINFFGCDFSGVLIFNGMFYGCSGVEYIVPVNFLSGTKPYALSEMFLGMFSLEHISLEGVDFSQCTDMYRVFYNCQNLECITNIDTRGVTTKTEMFYGCDSLIQPDSAAVSDITDSDGAVWVNPDVCSGIRAFRQKESLPHIRHFEQKESLMSILTDFTQKETFPAIYTFSQSETYPAIYRFMQKESLMSVLTDFMQKESLMSRARVFRQLESYEEEKIYAVSYFRQRESLEAVENREKLIKVVPV